MSRNIKEIGKELMGKSLNSFHRKTGLTQLEKNNERQDGILDGILSQVDDAYIEKTEQSNVIHLDGSGDGVVVLDSLEGNTMVNCINRIPFNTTPTTTPNTVYCDNDGYITVNAKEGSYTNAFISKTYCNLKPNTKYTLIIEVVENTLSGAFIIGEEDRSDICTRFNFRVSAKQTGIFKIVSTTKDGEDFTNGQYALRSFAFNTSNLDGEKIKYRVFILEGDYSNVEVNYFEGLQSSFEEKVNNEGKYEIEILSNNKSLIDWNIENLMSHENNQFEFSLEDNAIKVRSNYGTPYQFKKGFYVKEGEKYTIQIEGRKTSGEYSAMYMGGEDLCYPKEETYILVPARTVGNIIDGTSYGKKTVTMIARKSGYVDRFNIHSSGIGNFYWIKNMYLEKGETVSCIPHKHNKIKLLINEPLRAIDDVKDRLCIKDGKLVIERKCRQWTLNGSEDWVAFIINANNAQPNIAFAEVLLTDNNKSNVISNISTSIQDLWGNSNYISETISVKYYGDNNRKLQLITPTSNLQTNNISGFKNYLNQRYENGNPIKAIYELSQPVYEEVLNEYGEPILLEGYENGTIYIDSTIVPTTTVRYTPKMESFKTLKEVENNNIMLTNDVNDNIIPYMMDVDMMILEKEMALMSHQYKLRRTGEKDMTSMQKRTQDMLERLIKGKTLTEQECKTRVVTYLDAGKITDAQADELMLLISEVYA